MPPVSPMPPLAIGEVSTKVHATIQTNERNFRLTNQAPQGDALRRKMMVLAQGWAIDISGGPHFSDTPPGNPFYQYIETAYHHAVIGGYPDGKFRPNNNSTRAQIAKIVYLARN